MISKLLLSFGNRKLPKTTAIFNMGPAKTCPSDKLGLCKVSDICYAKKSERLYRHALPYRERQAEYWLSCTAETFVADFLNQVKRKKTAVKYLRFNESGDFYTQDCVNKAEKIAKLLRVVPIFVYMYTARIDLNFDACKELIITGSGFMVHNQFNVVNAFTGENRQCKANCNICSLCTKQGKYTIEALKH